MAVVTAGAVLVLHTTISQMQRVFSAFGMDWKVCKTTGKKTAARTCEASGLIPTAPDTLTCKDALLMRVPQGQAWYITDTGEALVAAANIGAGMLIAIAGNMAYAPTVTELVAATVSPYFTEV